MLAMQLMFSQDVYMAHCILRGRMCFLLFNLTISMHSYTEDISKAQPISRFYGRDADREMDGFPWNGQFSVKFREILQFCPFAYTIS